MSETKVQYVTLDVFTQTRYEGNPLAIVRMPPPNELSQQQKQVIAREFNYSETVILHEKEESYRTSEWTINIFTAINELPLAGHPVIGTICYLGKSWQARGAGGVLKGALLTKAGRVPFEYNTSSAQAIAQIPHDVHVHSRKFVWTEAQEVGIPEAVVAQMPEESPFVSIVKGMTFAIVELPNLEALGALPSALRVHDEHGLTPEYAGRGFAGTLFYVRQGRSDQSVVQLRTRMIQRFEDPATGSASSACASWIAMQLWSDPAQKKDSYTFQMTQGVEMGQKSIINLGIDLNSSGEVSKVMLGGTAVQVMDGTLPVP